MELSSDLGAARRTGSRVAVVGAGPGGICAAVVLRSAGYDVAVFERASQVGGVWHHNRYPGVACDIEAHLYSYSFDTKLDWSRPYARGSEIRDYLEGVVERFGLEPVLNLATPVEALSWDHERAVWHVELGDGRVHEAEFVVSAMGLFGEPAVPDIDGLETFAGAALHSARWDHEMDLTGRDVAVIGSAASGVQLIPEVAAEVRHLDVYQRTPNWVLPKSDTPFTPSELEGFRRDPSILAARRQAMFDLIDTALDYTSNQSIAAAAEQVGLDAINQVHDPVVRAQLTPDHPWGCKRPLLSNDYYPTFNRDNVKLVTDRIDRITPEGIVAGGELRPVDAIIFATGFRVGEYLTRLHVSGRKGITIHDAWGDTPSAHLGIMVPGFPNLFMLYGPNTNGGNSIISMLECQTAYVRQLLELVEDEGFDWIDVSPAALHDYDSALQADLDAVEVWKTACNHYYSNPAGRIVTQWPRSFGEYQRQVGEPALAVFECGRSGSEVPTP